MTDTVLSVMALAVLALLGGIALLWRRGGSPRQIVLMAVLVLVILGNIAIVAWPDASGESPLLEAQPPE